MPKPYLNEISQHHKTNQTGRKSIALLDIDDTLVDCRHRKLAVLRRYAESLTSDHADREKILALKLEDMQYRVYDSLDRAAVDDLVTRKACFQYWLQHYFSKPYFLQDTPFPGAAEFTGWLVENGIDIIYLTARDQMNMGEATTEYLKNSKFCFGNQQTSLIMKSDSKEYDADFKLRILEEVAAEGEVIVAMENELRHLNQMAEHFPKALMYWRNTRFSPEQPEAHERIKILEAF